MNTKLTSKKRTLIIISWLTLVLIGCNLGTSGNAPPTLVPRMTVTPPPTLGFNGVANGSEIGLGNIETPVSDPELAVYELTQQVDIDRLMTHVEALQNFGTRHVNSLTSSSTWGIGAARNYIKSQFEQIAQTNGNLSVWTHEFSLTWDGVSSTQQNVVGVLQGTEPGASTVVIGAHYDSIVAPDFNDGESNAPGANDNGTGTAALIELARIMSQRQYRSTILFVAFSAEEVGRRGSIAFVDFLQARNIDIVGMVNLDTIGNTNDRNGLVNDSQLRLFSRAPNTSSSRLMARTVEFLGFVHDAPLELSMQETEDRDGRYGDHFSFSEAGFPAIRVINALEEKTNGDPTDTISFIERDYFQKAVQSVLIVIVALADGPLPPRNVTLRDANNGEQTLVWEPVPNATGYVIALRWPGQLRYDQQINCDLGGSTCDGSSLTWDGFSSRAGIAVAARGANGIIGRLSDEYLIQGS